MFFGRASASGFAVGRFVAALGVDMLLALALAGSALFEGAFGAIELRGVAALTAASVGGAVAVPLRRFL
ncbi:MAG TPA: hypothetical protein VGI70_13910, partial [Polyangiales bacterium]